MAHKTLAVGQVDQVVARIDRKMADMEAKPHILFAQRR